jgi:hypothetical protein
MTNLRILTAVLIVSWMSSATLAAPAVKGHPRPVVIKPEINHSAALSVQVRVISAAETPKIPNEFALMQNYPNPFNPITQIGYVLGSRVHARLDVYNVLGKRVDTLVNEEQDAGHYSYSWSRPELASGVYYYHLQAGTFSQTRRMLLVK